MDKPHYEVFSLHVASDPYRTVGCNFFFDSFPASPAVEMPQDYLFWVIRGAGRCIVVDTVFTSASAQHRGRQMHKPVEAHLQGLGIDPTQVTDLVLTHMHWDHAGNLGLFPQARIHLQASELAFCTGPEMSRRSISKIYSVEDIQAVMSPLFQGRVNLIDGNAELFPGVLACHVGGHTPGSMVLSISTARGDVVLSSDAAHFWANVRRGTPFPILESFSGALSAFDRLFTLAGGDLSRIIPGHDPLLRQVFPDLKEHRGATMLHVNPEKNVIDTVDSQFLHS